MPNACGFLLLRRAGGLWGIANTAVEGLGARGEGYRISVGGRTLAADEILAVVEHLTVRPSTAVLRRFWAEMPAGLAVHGRLPLVVVDPLHPPAALWLDEGEGLDEARD